MDVSHIALSDNVEIQVIDESKVLNKNEVIVKY
jgi:hypothetical protein